MAVRLRLRRMGKKKQPIYKIVAADSRAKRDGRFLEAVGLYNPLTSPMTIDLHDDRIFHWLKNGALPTETVKNLFQRKGLWLRWNLMRKKADEATIAAAFEKWQMDLAAKAQREVERNARKKASKKQKAAATAPAAAPATA